MTRTEPPTLSQVEQLLAESGYDVAELPDGVLRVRDVDTGIAFQAALEGNVLYMNVSLTTLPCEAVTPDILRRMLSADNGIATSAFQLLDSTDGRCAITLNNFCTLQNMGAEDKDDVLSLASYLMADLIEARSILNPLMQAATPVR